MTANASAHDDSRSQRLKREAGNDAAAQGANFSSWVQMARHVQSHLIVVKQQMQCGSATMHALWP